jgi:hypothetical protein
LKANEYKDPEEKLGDFNQQDIYTYSSIVSNEESISAIKEQADTKKNPKPLDDENAILAFID